MNYEIIYNENLTLNIDEEIKYHKNFGILRTTEFLKNWLAPVLAMAFLTFVAYVCTESYPVYGYIIIFFLLSGVAFFIHKSSMKKSIINVCKFNFDYSFSKNSSKKITLKENGIEVLAPYSKAYVPYYDIEKFTSDPLAFSFKFKALEKVCVIPKNGQDPDLLFCVDNAMREKLGDRFIYEM